MHKTAKAIVLLCALVLLGACGGGGSDQAGTQAVDKGRNIRWKMVTTWPPNFPILQEGAQRFADQVAAMSAGQLQIHVFAGGELVPALQVFDAVSQGAVEVGHGAAYYWAGKVPAAQFLSTVPFGMTANGAYAWIYHGGGLQIWRELYKPFGVIPFPAGNTGVQMGGWFKKRIDSLEDLKGLKMRIPGIGGKVLAAAGGNPVLMAGGELYTALERGTIDATEWIGPFHDQRLGLASAADYYYYPGWHEPGTVLELIVNERAWQRLPEHLRAIVENAAMASNIWMISEFEAANSSALKTLAENPRIEILPFPADVVAELKRLTDQALAEEAAKDPDFQRVYQAYRQFNTTYSAWNAISNEAYQQVLRDAP
jgi:TRAP-type mannitol/chloroaromatic compound transport system substrate-binding protein